MPERFEFSSPPQTTEEPPHETTTFEKLCSSVAARLAASTISLSAATCATHEHPSRSSPPAHGDTQQFTQPTPVPEKSRAVSVFDSANFETDFFAPHPRGEYTPAEHVAHTRHLSPNVEIFQDVILEFYHVRAGDSIGRIRALLAAFPQYAYLKNQKMKQQSFNILNSTLRPGMWIPIPLPNMDRHITDEAFAAHIEHAVDEFATNKKYGAFVHRMEAQHGMTREKFIAAILAMAKQESGGKPLGQFEFHRWEGHHRHHAFSFSFFHVVMEGPGLRARKNLDMTEGQTYHPRNATKLFLAFLCEKAHEMHHDIFSDFPFTKKSLQSFSRFYNGAYKPSYPKNVLRFYQEALARLTSQKHAVKKF